MASIFKPNGSDKYVIVYRDEHGKRRWKIENPQKMPVLFMRAGRESLSRKP
jgi:hypothetical protein